MVTYYVRTRCEFPNYFDFLITDYKLIKVNIEGRHAYITYGMQYILGQLDKLKYINDGLVVVNEVEEKQLIKEIERANKKLQIKMLQR